MSIVRYLLKGVRCFCLWEAMLFVNFLIDY